MNVHTQHRDGVPWHKARKPWRLHRCRVQTCGFINLDHIDRCSCGAIRVNGGAWRDRNSR